LARSAPAKDTRAFHQIINEQIAMISAG